MYLILYFYREYRCSCGNCQVEHLINVREFWCCFKVLEVTGKFTFIGKDGDCILNHDDFSPLTHGTILLQAGPLLRDKNGRYYKQKERSDNAKNKWVCLKIKDFLHQLELFAFFITRQIRRVYNYAPKISRFLRAVSYHWLACWLFGQMGWENTQPLPACMYDHIIKTFTTSESKGYESGKECAKADDWNAKGRNFFTQF